MPEPSHSSRPSAYRFSNRFRLLLVLGSATAWVSIGASMTLSGCAAELAEPTKYDIYKDASPITTGGSTGSGGGGGGGGGLPCDINAVITASCSPFGCHGKMTPASNLDLETQNYPALVNMPATHEHILDGTQGNCMAGELRIDGTNPDNSVILKKIYSKQSCGGAMPVLPRTIDDAQRACFRAWVWGLANKPVPTTPYMVTGGSTGGSGGSGGGAAGSTAGGTGGTGGGSGGTGGASGGTGGGGGTGGT